MIDSIALFEIMELKPSEQSSMRSPCVHVELIDVGAHVDVGTDRAGDDRTIRVHACFFGGDLASFDEVSHERMVARDLLQVAFVQEVGTRIAHLRDEQAFAFEHGLR